MLSPALPALENSEGHPDPLLLSAIRLSSAATSLRAEIHHLKVQEEKAKQQLDPYPNMLTLYHANLQTFCHADLQCLLTREHVAKLA